MIMRSNAVGVKELGIFGNFDLKEKKKKKKSEYKRVVITTIKIIRKEIIQFNFPNINLILKYNI